MAPRLAKPFDEVLNVDVNDSNRLSFQQLRDEINADRARGEDARGKEVDLYGKIALPLASSDFRRDRRGAGPEHAARRPAKRSGFGMAIFIVSLLDILSRHVRSR